MLVVHWIDVQYLVMPNVNETGLPFGLIDICCLIGLGLIFFAGILTFAGNRPWCPPRIRGWANRWGSRTCRGLADMLADASSGMAPLGTWHLRGSVVAARQSAVLGPRCRGYSELECDVQMSASLPDSLAVRVLKPCWCDMAFNDGVKVGPVAYIGLVSVLVTFVLVLMLQVLYFQQHNEMVAAELAAEGPPPELAELTAKQQTALTQRGYVDRAAGHCGGRNQRGPWNWC